MTGADHSSAASLPAVVLVPDQKTFMEQLKKVSLQLDKIDSLLSDLMAIFRQRKLLLLQLSQGNQPSSSDKADISVMPYNEGDFVSWWASYLAMKRDGTEKSAISKSSVESNGTSTLKRKVCDDEIASTDETVTSTTSPSSPSVSSSVMDEKKCEDKKRTRRFSRG